MKLLKPNWVHHDDNPIFSIDVHPDSSRFATGGQGKDSGRIVIWNMGPVIDPKQEADPNTPRVLCQMDHHIACVNVVRWSNNGLFLASGSDDKLIMIWNFVSGGSYENIENWKCGYTLRAHNGDVLDLAWSAKDQFLASCSVDNTIIIWNALKFPDIITRINAHNGFVKGVAWDPVGTFFASQSDDKTLKIWKTLDWTLEKSIEEPFKDCTGTTHVLRLNWSPDGQLVISAHAINNGAPTAQIIDRTNKWNTKLDFVGHRKAVTAVRFYPQIMKEEETKAKKTYCVCALGSRDRTLSVWLTKTSRPLCVVHDLFDNPVVDLAWSKRPKPALLACSMDGTIVCIEFEHSEIGYPLSKPETEEFFMNKYNYDVNATISIKDTNVPQFNAASAAAAKEKEALKFIENYDILLAQEKKQNELLEKKQQQQMKFEDSSQSTNMTTTSSNTQTLEAQKQIERRLPDGRRRITPICVSKPGEYDTPRPFGSIVGGGTHPQFERHGFSSSIGFGGQSSSNLLASPSSSSFVSRTATEQSTIIVEKRDERDQIVEVSPVKSIVYVKSGSLLGPPSTSAGHNSNNSSDVVFTAKTTSGAPQLITTEKSTESDKQSSTKPVISTETKPQQQSQPKAAPSTPSASKPTSTSQPPPSKSTPSIPKPSTTTSTKPTTTSTSSKDAGNNKPTATTSSTNQKQPQQQQPKPTTATNKPTTATAQDTNKRQQDVEVVTATSNATTVSASEAKRPRLDQSVSLDQRYLIPLRIEANSSTRIHKHDNKKITLVIENSVNITTQQQQHHHHSNEENENKVSLLKCFENDKVLKWQHCFFSRICEVTCNKYYVSCVCEDATLSLIKLNQGTQVCCPIVLDSRAAVLNSSLNYCMCLTSNAYLYVWRYFDSSGDNNHISDSEAGNFFNLTALISQLPCQFLLRDRALNKAFITDSGVPVLQMSGSKSYFYSTHTKSWHLIPMSGLVNGPSSASKIQLSLASSTQFDGGESSASLSLHHHHHHHNWPLDEIQARQHSSNLLKIIETMNKSLGQQSGGELFSSSNSSRNDFTISYLESQINAAAGLNSAKEYKFWLVTYARYLIEHDNQDKLNELCYFLLGPLYSTNWNENVMIYKKRDLLKEILPIVAQNVAMQRIYIFFKKQLNLAETMGQKSTSSVLDRIKASSSNSNFSSKLQQNSSKMRSLETLLQPKSAQPQETITTEENMETDEQKTERAIKPDENQAQTQPQIQPQTSESKPSSVEVEMEVESVKENGSSNHVENENEEEKSVEQPVILVKDQSQQEEKQQEQPEQQSEAIIEQQQSETIIEQPVDNQNQDENKQ